MSQSEDGGLFVDGWFGVTKDGYFTDESFQSWEEVKEKMDSLGMWTTKSPRVIKLPPNLGDVQGKTARANLSSGEVQLESRYIGFFLGNNLVKIRIDEKTGDINVEVVEQDA